MDPKQALIDLLESIYANDTDGAKTALANLLEWRAKSGFVPEALYVALDALRLG